MPEWFNGAVSKTVVALAATESSNLSLSAGLLLTRVIMKLINFIIIIAICFGILFLSFQSEKKIDIFRLEKIEGFSFITYNHISIKQIDSLTADKNLRFSELFAERVKIK